MILLNTHTILVPTDFSITASKAIEHAAFLAQLSKGSLLLLHVERKKDGYNTGHMEELRLHAAQRQHKRLRLKELGQKIHTEYGVDVKIKITRGEPSTAVAEVAEQRNAGLIIMGTDGDESVSHLFLANNSNRVLSKTSIPVMTVRSQAGKHGYTRILLPLGYSGHSRQKVNLAVQLAKLFAAKIYAVALISENEEHLRYKLEVILNQVKELAVENGVGIETQLTHSNGPAETTLALAELLNTDLIISMTDERSGPMSFLGEKFDETLVNQSKVPVLSVPPQADDESLEYISVAGF